MAKVKIEITTDLGESIFVERDLSLSSELDSFNKIEQFTLQIRRELFPEIQQELLTKSQADYKKKSRKLQWSALGLDNGD
jgi:hypothetical protein